MKFPRSCLSVSVALSAMLVGLVGAQEEGRTDYPIPSHGKITLKVPSGWRVATRPTAEPPSVYLRAEPQSGSAFSLQITAVWLDSTKLKKVTPQSMKRDAARTADGLLAQSVEKAAPLHDLVGAQAHGVYYSLTDRAPAPGESRYLTQGTLLCGEALFAFTFLHHETTSAEHESALQMLADARYAP